MLSRRTTVCAGVQHDDGNPLPCQGIAGAEDANSEMDPTTMGVRRRSGEDLFCHSDHGCVQTGRLGCSNDYCGGGASCEDGDVVLSPRSGMEHRVRVLARQVGTDGDVQVRCACVAARDDVVALLLRGVDIRNDEEEMQVMQLVRYACALRRILRKECPCHGWVRREELDQVAMCSVYEQCAECDDFCGIEEDEFALVRRGSVLLRTASAMEACHILACGRTEGSLGEKRGVLC
jgi:hypothetical protein